MPVTVIDIIDKGAVFEKLVNGKHVDISSSTELTNTNLAAADTFLVDDGDSGTEASTKKIKASSIATYIQGAILHDSLSDFVSDEHIDWTAASAGTIHATNYTNTTYSVMELANSYAAGLVPAGSGTHNDTYLRKDGTWGTPINTDTDTNTNQLTEFTLRDDDNDDFTIGHDKVIKVISATGTLGTNIIGTGSSGDPIVLTVTSPDTNTNQLTTFTLRDDDDDDFTIAHGKFVKVESAVGAVGTNIAGAGTDGDPWVLTVTSPDTNTNQLTKMTLGAEVGTIGGSGASFLAEHGDTINFTASRGTVAVSSPSADEYTFDIAITTMPTNSITYAMMQNVVDDERLLGRVSGADGDVEELTKAQINTMLSGISDGDFVVVDASDVAEDDYAIFTTNGVDGKSATQVKQDLSLNNVENTALSTWAGSSNITTLGTITNVNIDSGNIDGTDIGDTTQGTGAFSHLYLKSANTHKLQFLYDASDTLTASRTLTINQGDANRAITLGGDITTTHSLSVTGVSVIDQDCTSGASPTFNSSNFSTIAIANGGTGDTTVGGARSNLTIGEGDDVIFADIKAKKNADGGTSKITIYNSNNDAGTDKKAILKFSHATTGGGEGNAGMIESVKEGSYATAGATDSTMNFYTTENGTDNVNLKIYSDGQLRAKTGYTPSYDESLTTKEYVIDSQPMMFNIAVDDLNLVPLAVQDTWYSTGYYNSFVNFGSSFAWESYSNSIRMANFIAPCDLTIKKLYISFYWDQGTGTAESLETEFEIAKATPAAGNSDSTWSWSAVSPSVAGSLDLTRVNQLKHYKIDAAYNNDIDEGDAVALCMRYTEAWTGADNTGSTGATITKSVVYGVATLLCNKRD